MPMHVLLKGFSREVVVVGFLHRKGRSEGREGRREGRGVQRANSLAGDLLPQVGEGKRSWGGGVKQSDINYDLQF